MIDRFTASDWVWGCPSRGEEPAAEVRSRSAPVYGIRGHAQSCPKTAEHAAVFDRTGPRRPG
jgi:hypothetical protein